MSQLFEELQEAFSDEETRYAYAEAFLNASVAAQIKKFRGDMSQEELALQIGTKQSGISRLESVNYSSWKVETLRKLARAFGLRLRISFEEWGTLVSEIENFRRGFLHRRQFAVDPNFNRLGRNTFSAQPEDHVGSAMGGQELVRIPPAPSGSLRPSMNTQPVEKDLKSKTENAVVADAPNSSRIDSGLNKSQPILIDSGRKPRTNRKFQHRTGRMWRGR